MPGLVKIKALRNIRTMTSINNKQHNLSMHDALIRAAAIVREHMRYTQEIKVLQARIGEINARLANLNDEQACLMSLGLLQDATFHAKTPINLTMNAEHGFTIKY